MDNTMTTEMQKQEYELIQSQEEEAEAKRVDEQRKREYEMYEDKRDSPLGDIYDVFAKAINVHSKMSGMSQDYTLTRYDEDIYNMKMPKFVREQRKLLRIIKSYILVNKNILNKFYNNKIMANIVYEGLRTEYEVIEELIIGELDETVIMGRTPKGEVIKAVLQCGMNPELREGFENETDRTGIKQKLNERSVQ